MQLVGMGAGMDAAVLRRAGDKAALPKFLVAIVEVSQIAVELAGLEAVIRNDVVLRIADELRDI